MPSTNNHPSHVYIRFKPTVSLWEQLQPLPAPKRSTLIKECLEEFIKRHPVLKMIPLAVRESVIDFVIPFPSSEEIAAYLDVVPPSLRSYVIRWMVEEILPEKLPELLASLPPGESVTAAQ